MAHLLGSAGLGEDDALPGIARETDAVFLPTRQSSPGIKEITDGAKDDLAGADERPAILFIDEIHRFNKAQQDALLPFVEEGTVTLFGTTTENPSFEIRNALLSLCRVLVLSPLTAAQVETIARRALSDTERGLGKPEPFLEPDALRHIVEISDGDARVALNALEAAVAIAEHKGLGKVDVATAEEARRRKALLSDKDGEEHYNLISAFHKSLRGSDPDASLYWLARMLEAGEDPLYIARRMVRFASEDVGNAAPGALQLTLAASEAYRMLGGPRGAGPGAYCHLSRHRPQSNRVHGVRR
jgi:putative ATPase